MAHLPSVASIKVWKRELVFDLKNLSCNEVIRFRAQGDKTLPGMHYDHILQMLFELELVTRLHWLRTWRCMETCALRRRVNLSALFTEHFQAWSHEILKSKTNKPPKLLSSSGIGGTIAFWIPKLWWCVWHKARIAFVQKYVFISWFFKPFKTLFFKVELTNLTIGILLRLHMKWASLQSRFLIKTTFHCFPK